MQRCITDQSTENERLGSQTYTAHLNRATIKAHGDSWKKETEGMRELRDRKEGYEVLSSGHGRLSHSGIYSSHGYMHKIKPVKTLN